MTATSYCVPCRRHLNGAFSCPGCGAPAGAGPVPEAARAPATAVLPAVVADRPRRDRAGSRRRAGGPGRRVAVLTAAGLVLGGAGVVAATVDRGAGSPPPAPVSTPDRQAPSSSAPASAPPSGRPAPSATTAKPSRSPGAKPSGAAPATAAPPTAAPAPATTPAPVTPAPTASGGQPGSKPSPSPTCTPVLFWCR